MDNEKCVWDPSKHNDDPCPHHDGGTTTNKVSHLEPTARRAFYSFLIYKNKYASMPEIFDELRGNFHLRDEEVSSIIRILYERKMISADDISSITRYHDYVDLSWYEEPEFDGDDEYEPSYMRDDASHLRQFNKFTKPVSIENAAKNSNPKYDPKVYEYSYNCQRCVVAYEMQRRGYDVEALPRKKTGDTIFEKGTSWEDAMGVRGHWWGLKYIRTTSDLKYHLEKYIGTPNTRWVIHVEWANSNSAHVFIAEVDSKGAVRYVDPQTGDINKKWMSRVKRNKTSWVRVDNKNLNTQVEYCVKNRGED